MPEPTIVMQLKSNNGSIVGTYGHDGGTISGGVLDGLVLRGKWSQSGSAGIFEFTIDSDCKSFEGNWKDGYKNDGKWKGKWFGQRPPEPDMGPGSIQTPGTVA
jgi:hypothetical protein